MKSKLSLIVFSLLMAVALAGCWKKTSSNTNANSNTSNSNTTATTTTDNSNLDETTMDDSLTNSSTIKTKNGNKTPPKNTNDNATFNKRPDKEPPVKSTEKQIRKQGDRALKDAGGLINEGERRVRGILNGRP